MQIGAYRFDRMEIAGSLGDLGTLLPIALGLVLVNGLAPTGIFLAAGLFYIAAGSYYRVPVAVQPMKVIGAYAIAHAVSVHQIHAAGLYMAVIFLAIGFSGAMDAIVTRIHREVIRGIQASTGLLLAMKGIEFITGHSLLQATRGAAEPFLTTQTLLGIPVGYILGPLFLCITLAFLKSRKFPAALLVVGGGVLAGLILGAGNGQTTTIAENGSWFLPYGLPGWADMAAVILTMVLPQTPMTLGNAVLANADLSNTYFPEAQQRVTPRALCISIGVANALSVFVGGMPMCHGAGGLAGHYRFGARTAGSNLVIGGLLLTLALLPHGAALGAVHMLPLSVLGVLLFFAGTELCLNIGDLFGKNSRRNLFVVFSMTSLTLVANLAWAFVAGLVLSFLLRKERFTI